MNRKPKQGAIQGVPLADIAERFGTPLYVYDAEAILRRLEQFRHAFAGIDLEIKFAMKSCPNISIVKLMRRYGTGLDTVSIPEIQVGLRTGFEPRQIVFTPNLVPFDEIRQAVAMGAAINIENLSNLEKFGAEYGSGVPCCIRLNPHIISEVERGDAAGLRRFNLNREHYAAVDRERVDAWHNQSKFGISLSLFDRLMEIVGTYGIHVNGIHIHSSHVIMSREIFMKGAAIVFDIARHFKDLAYLDFGGGISVPHKPDEACIDIEGLGAEFKTAFEHFCTEYGKPLALWFEPGRFLVSEAGVLITRVDLLKSNGTVQFAGVNSGFNHLLRPMMYDAYHEIVNISNPDGRPGRYTVVGNLCEIDDLGRDRMLSEVRENDLLAIKNAGAYGFSMSSQYNFRFRPAEVLVLDGVPRLIRERETLADFLQNQIELDL